MFLAFAFEEFVSNYTQQLDRGVDGSWLHVRRQFPYSQQNPFGCIRCSHQTLYGPPKFRITVLFSRYLGLSRNGVTIETLTRGTATPGASSSRGWEFVSELPSSFQPFAASSAEGKGSCSGMPGSGRAARGGAGHTADPRQPRHLRGQK